MNIRTTTSTVVSFIDRSVLIDVDEHAGAIFFEDRKSGYRLSVELTGDQLTQLASVFAEDEA